MSVQDIPPLLNGQLRLLIENVAACTDTWPETIELGVFAMSIGYLASLDEQATILALEAELDSLRSGKGVANSKKMRASTERLMNAAHLRRADAAGSA